LWPPECRLICGVELNNSGKLGHQNENANEPYEDQFLGAVHRVSFTIFSKNIKN